MQKKNIRQSIFGIILTAYSLLYPIFASFYREEIAEGVKVLRFAPALGLLVASGLIGATVLFARKMLDDSSKKLITLAALVETVILAVAGIIAAFSRKNIIYNILEVIAAAVVMILFIWICKGKVKFIDTCSDKVFWITLVAMYLIFPSVAILLKELILLLLALVVIAAALLSGLGFVFSAKPQSAPTVTYKDVYVDAKGKEHDTAYGAQVANESYDD